MRGGEEGEDGNRKQHKKGEVGIIEKKGIKKGIAEN